MIRLLLAALIVGLSITAQAQSTKKSPGEMAAEDTAKTEKRAACLKQSKEKEPKLGFMARRKFVDACVNG
jgi:hypothetical protein